jgi:hypothetical protein
VVVFSSVVCVAVALVYWLMRLGFDNPLLPVAKAVGLSLFLIGFPWLVRFLLARIGRFSPERWYLSYSFLWVIGIALTGALGWTGPSVGSLLIAPLALVGVAAFVMALMRWLRVTRAWTLPLYIIGFAVFGGWAAGVVWGRIYKSPMFLEMLVANGVVHHDGLSLGALGGMLRTYGVASSGVDGLYYYPYHWGSAWLFAQWSSLTGSSVLSFYQLGYVVTVIPLFFGALLAFAVEMRPSFDASETRLLCRPLAWSLFLLACVGFLPLAGLDALGVWTSNYLISESYAIAVPIVLLMVATAAAFHRTRSSSDNHSRWGESTSERLFAIVFVPLSIAALGYLKISLMILSFVLALYVLLRGRSYHRPLYFAAAAIATALVIVVYANVSQPGHREGFAPLDFLSNYVARPWWPFFLLVHLLWVWVYVFVRLRSLELRTLGDVERAIRTRQIIDVEAVVVIGLVGLAPGLVLHIDGGSAFYFSDFQRWLALGLLLAILPVARAGAITFTADVRRELRLIDRLRHSGLRSAVLVFLLLPIALALLSNAVFWPLQMLRANADTRRALYPAEIANSIPAGIHGLPRLLDATLLSAGLQSSSRYVVVEKLTEIARTSPAVRRQTAVFIPQDDSSYWTMLSRRGACSFQSLVAPALAEVAMIDGMPAYGCPPSRYYGMGSFPPRTRPQSSSDTTDAALCNRARSWGFRQVLVLHFEQPATRTVSCPHS